MTSSHECNEAEVRMRTRSGKRVVAPRLSPCHLLGRAASFSTPHPVSAPPPPQLSLTTTFTTVITLTHRCFLHHHITSHNKYTATFSSSSTSSVNTICHRHHLYSFSLTATSPLTTVLLANHTVVGLTTPPSASYSSASKHDRRTA